MGEEFVLGASPHWASFKEGHVDLFMGLQQGIIELLQLADLNDPESGRSMDPTKRWGVCIKRNFYHKENPKP
jgi:hypothetical protein